MNRHYLLAALVAGAAALWTVLCVAGDGRPSNSPASSQDVFTLRDGKFFLEGKPFAEISFNKFDLFWAVWQGMGDSLKKGQADPQRKAIASQDKALNELHSMGFRTIRFFASPFAIASQAYDDPKAKDLWFRALDTTLDLCDRHQIKVVLSLGAAAMHDPAAQKGHEPPAGREGPAELIGDPASRSRRRLYAYLDEIVSRYKDRKTVAMWEITNELTNSANIGTWKGERMPTLAQVAGFYNDVARRIKQNDPLRLVSNGGSHLREHAWNLHLGHGWKQRDTLEEHQRAFSLLFARSAVDVVDIHFYAVRQGGYEIIGPDGKPMLLTLARYRDIVGRLGKGLVIGEYGALPSGWSDGGKKKAADPQWFEGYNDPLAEKWVQKAVDDVLKAGVPLAYFWCYQSDRPMDQKENPITFDKDKTARVMRIIIDGNRRLKERLGSP